MFDVRSCHRELDHLVVRDEQRSHHDGDLVFVAIDGRIKLGVRSGQPGVGHGVGRRGGLVLAAEHRQWVGRRQCQPRLPGEVNMTSGCKHVRFMLGSGRFTLGSGRQ